MKKACDVCRALLRDEGEYRCLLGFPVMIRVDRRRGEPALGDGYPAPAAPCPKPVTREAFAQEVDRNR